MAENPRPALDIPKSNFWRPQEAPLAQPIATPPGVPCVLLLQALVSNGAFAAMTPLCTAENSPAGRARLESLFTQWLATNRMRYGGRVEVLPVPWAGS